MVGSNLESHLKKTRSLKREGYSLPEIEDMVAWERDHTIRMIIAERAEQNQQRSSGDGGYSAAMAEAIVRKRK